MTDAVSNSETAAELAPTFRQPQAETSPDLFRTATTPITVAERPTVWIDRLIAVLVLGLAVLVLRKLQSGSAQVVSGITKDMAR